MSCYRKSWPIWAATVGVVCLVHSAAFGALVLTLDDLGIAGIEVIVVDGMPIGTGTTKGPSTHVDANALAGRVSFGGVVGGFTITDTTGTSKPVVGDADTARLDLTNFSTKGIGTLEIMLTDTGFMLAGQTTQPIILTHTMAGTDFGDSVSAAGFLDEANMEFGASRAAAVLSVPPPAGPAFALEGVTVGPPLAMMTPFSLSETVKLVHSSMDQISDFNTTLKCEVPEPSSVAMWGLVGCVGLVTYRRRRRSIPTAS